MRSVDPGTEEFREHTSHVSLRFSSESGIDRITFTLQLLNRSAEDISGIVLCAAVPPGCRVILPAEEPEPGITLEFHAGSVTWSLARVGAGGTAGPLQYTVDTREASQAAFWVHTTATWSEPEPGEAISETIIACPLTTYPYLKKKSTARQGMVSSLDPRASAIGVEILRRGGNAVDAALATAFAVGVVEPQMSGIGGKGGYMLVYLAETGRVEAVDFNARAPLKATPDMFLDDEGRIREGENEHGPLSVCVPSTIAGHALALEQFGTLGWAEVIEPALRLAEQGYQVNEAVHRYMVKHRDLLARVPATARLYLKEGRPFETGEWLYPHDLADSYRKIAEGGPGVFYRGEIARAMASDMARLGGLIGLEDLARYRACLGETSSTSYRGYEVFTYAVNSGGSATLANLNLLENFSFQGLQPSSAEAIHLLAEAIKVTFSDRFEYVGDPEYVRLPLRGLVSKEYARQRAKLIRLDRASSFPPGDPWLFNDPDTTHLSVVDQDRNMVALTTSVGPDWGSGIVVEGTGILLNGGMNRFDPRPERPNSVAPYKRPLRNTNPILLLREGRPYMTLGCPGGERQISSIASVLVNHLDLGMELQEAIDAPRFHTQGGPLILQDRLPASVYRQLQSMGHELRLIDSYATLARVHGVMIDPTTGELHGGADPSSPGAAVGY